MRMRRADRPDKRIGGRHRRQPQPKHRPPASLAVAVATVAAGLAALFGAGGSMTDASQLAVPDPVPSDGPAPAVSEDEGLEPFLDPQHLEQVPVGPGSVAEPVQVVLSGSEVIETLGESGIPEVALRAYKQAEARLATRDESCGLPWSLLAAIGRVESNHGRFGGAQLRLDGSGTKPIRGIPLDGRPNVALIRDTDDGRLDGDPTYDRAVGPMQFIPSTWAAVGADGNGDGRRDPNNMYDAAEAAGVYLCTGDRDLRDPIQAARAVRRYNNADEYVRIVLDLARQYQSGRVRTVPTAPQPADGPSRGGVVEPPAAAPTPTATRPTSPVAPPATTTPPPRVTAPPAPPDETEPGASPTAPTEGPATTTSPAPEAPTEPPSEQPAEQPSEQATEAPATAAVGWAPAMREVVLSVLQESTGPADPDPMVCSQGTDQPPVAGPTATPSPSESADCTPS